MDWLDYREKLGIGFNDTDKNQYFYTNMCNCKQSSKMYRFSPGNVQFF